MKNINLEQFSSEKEYYEYLKNVCLNIKMNNQLSIGQAAIKMFYPLFRNYKIELEGVENIPTDTNVLFVLNHSTSHDIFTAYEFLSMLNRRGSVMVATDCLNPVTTEIFNISNATLLDRRNKEERRNSVLELSQKIINGNDGVIFGEGSWNLHPTLPMHVIQNGASKISLITKVPIIPTIVEYVEVDDGYVEIPFSGQIELAHKWNFNKYIIPQRELKYRFVLQNCSVQEEYENEIHILVVDSEGKEYRTAQDWAVG